MYFSKEQLEVANSVDLHDFLLQNGEPLEKAGIGSYRLKNNHSMVVTGNKWYDFAETRGGHSVDFVKEFYSLSFQEAVGRLLGGTGYSLESPKYQSAAKKEEEPAIEFTLPEKDDNMKQTLAYLTKTRSLDGAVVQEFAKKGLIYQSKEKSKNGNIFHNTVFVGIDSEGTPKHAHKCSVHTFENRYRGNLTGSNAHYSFHWNGTSDHLFAFEAPIDLLSYITLHPYNWQKHSYVALCGVSSLAIHQYCQDHAIKQVTLCLDNDEAGLKAMERIGKELLDRGIVVDQKISRLKDWNDDCKFRKNNIQHHLEQAKVQMHGRKIRNLDDLPVVSREQNVTPVSTLAVREDGATPVSMTAPKQNALYSAQKVSMDTKSRETTTTALPSEYVQELNSLKLEEPSSSESLQELPQKKMSLAEKIKALAWKGNTFLNQAHSKHATHVL